MATYEELRQALRAVLRAVSAGSMRPNGVLFENSLRLCVEAIQGIETETPWTPFESATSVGPTPHLIETIMRQFHMPREEAERHAAELSTTGKLYVNSRYQVLVTHDGQLTYLSVKRIDQSPVRSWRDLQRIKNELVGYEHEAVELFPAASRTVDLANQYHLFCLAQAGDRFDFGFDQRAVDGNEYGGTGQEPFEEGQEL